MFAAIEIKRGELAHDVISLFMRASLDSSMLFKTLEVMGVLNLGTTRYVRFRTDAEMVFGILDDRRVITSEAGEYVLKVPDGGIVGKVPSVTMQATFETWAHKTYRGPKMPHWDRQFL